MHSDYADGAKRRGTRQSPPAARRKQWIYGGVSHRKPSLYRHYYSCPIHGSTPRPRTFSFTLLRHWGHVWRWKSQPSSTEQQRHYPLRNHSHCAATLHLPCRHSQFCMTDEQMGHRSFADVHPRGTSTLIAEGWPETKLHSTGYEGERVGSRLRSIPRVISTALLISEGVFLEIEKPESLSRSTRSAAKHRANNLLRQKMHRRRFASVRDGQGRYKAH